MAADRVDVAGAVGSLGQLAAARQAGDKLSELGGVDGVTKGKQVGDARLRGVIQCAQVGQIHTLEHLEKISLFIRRLEVVDDLVPHASHDVLPAHVLDHRVGVWLVPFILFLELLRHATHVGLHGRREDRHALAGHRELVVCWMPCNSGSRPDRWTAAAAMVVVTTRRPGKG